MRFLLAFLLAIAPMSAGAQPSTPAAKAAAPRPAPQWRVDMAASAVGFSSSADGTAFRGTFQRWSADIRFDAANLAGSSLRVAIEPASVNSGLSARDQTLQEADWFDTGKHRQVVFQSTSVRAAGAGYEAVGTITVKGRATPLTIPFTVSITGAQANAQGSFSLDRARLGLGAAFPATMIPATVPVSFRVRANRV
jgi:polyisoprenoid-binding protein YceI